MGTEFGESGMGGEKLILWDWWSEVGVLWILSLDRELCGGGQEGRDWDKDEQDGGATINSRRGTTGGRGNWGMRKWERTGGPVASAVWVL